MTLRYYWNTECHLPQETRRFESGSAPSASRFSPKTAEQKSLLRCLQTVEAPQLSDHLQQELAVPERRSSPDNLTPNFTCYKIVTDFSCKSMGLIKVWERKASLITVSDGELPSVGWFSKQACWAHTILKLRHYCHLLTNYRQVTPAI